MIWIDLAQLGFPYHTTYAGPRPTYINLHSDPPKCEPVYATQEHSTPPPWVIRPRRIHRMCTRYSHHLRRPMHSLWPILQGLDHTVAYNERSSIDTDRTITTRQPYRLNHQRHNSCPIRSQFNINLIMVLPWLIRRAEKSKVNMLLSNDETIIRFQSKSKHY
jgi:hypothetical protein